MTKWLLSAALILMAFPSGAIAQTKESLVGTWKLVCVTYTDGKGEVHQNVMGQNPTGFLTYTAEGRVSVIIAYDGRKPFADSSPSLEQTTEAFRTINAYAGSYTFTGDKVIHHIEVAWIQDLVNTDQVRSVKIEGDRLTLRGAFRVEGRPPDPGSPELVWERLKPSKP